MTSFSYIVINKLGKTQRGKLITGSFSQAKKSLEAQGLEIVACEEQKQQTVANIDITLFLKQLLFRKITDVERINFCHHLALMLKAGVPIIEGVEILETETASQKFKKLIRQLIGELEKGKSLSSVLIQEKFFNPNHLAILKSGESSGKIIESLKRIANDLKRDYQIKKKIKSAMSYPIIILLTLVGISTFILMFVLPKVGEVFRQMNVPLPLPTKILLGASFLLNHYFLIVLALVFTLAVVLFIFFTFTEMGPLLLGKIVAHLPVIKQIIYELNMARFIRSLSSLMFSGVPITEALNSAGAVFAGTSYQKAINDIQEKVSRGITLATAFQDYQKIFGGLLVKMFSVGERSGQLAEVLDDLALFYEGEVESKLESFTTIIEPLLMLLVGLGVGAMILAIIGPIYQMIGQMTTAT